MVSALVVDVCRDNLQVVTGGLHFIMLNSHRLFAITTVRLALEEHVLDPVIYLKVFFFH